MGAGHGVYVPDITHLNSTRGPQLVFCVSQGSTCLVRQPDPGVLAKKGMQPHTDTEIAFVSFLPNFISVDIALFSLFISITTTTAPFFLQLCIQPKKMSKKNNYDSEKKKDSKLPYVRPMGVPD